MNRQSLHGCMLCPGDSGKYCLTFGLKCIISFAAGGKAKHHFHITMPIGINVTKKTCHVRQVGLDSACSSRARQLGLDSAMHMQDILP